MSAKADLVLFSFDGMDYLRSCVLLAGEGTPYAFHDKTLGECDVVFSGTWAYLNLRSRRACVRIPAYKLIDHSVVELARRALAYAESQEEPAHG